MNLQQNKYLQISIVVVLCLFIEYLCFGRIFYCPNDMTFAFGGDALFLYFNTTFHTCHGSGYMLESMNYPFGESIFMTDAQGSLSILMSWLNDFGIDTCTYSIGIINGLILYLIPLCAVFLFLILRRYKLNIYYSIIVSIAIALLAPQTYRIVSHYGLSYPFYIPMNIYWVLRKFDLKRWEWKDVLFASVAAFFYLNNPYVGFAGLMFVPIITLIKAIITNERKSFFLQYFGLTASIIASGYAIIKLSDPFINRIKEQGGFFYYDVTLNGLFTSKYGFTSKLASKLHIPAAGFENTVNFGVVPLMGALTAFGFLIYFLRKKKPIQISYPDSDFKYILLGALLLGIIACNGIIPSFLEEYIKNNLSSLLLFKATGRFIWLAYFSVAIWMTWWLHQIAFKYFDRSKAFIILSLISTIWMWESYNGLKHYNRDMSKHGNMFKRSTNWKKYLDQNNINPEDYQAILALPIMQGWASKLTTPLHWRSQYESTTMSLTSGLPLVDGMLSRMSLDHAMNIVQLGSHPLIYKELVDQFPDERPILVMDMSEKESLLPNENYLLERSTPLTKYQFFDMYKLELDSLRSIPLIDSIKQKIINQNYTTPISYEGFQNDNTEQESRYFKGSGKIEIGEENVMWALKPGYALDSMDIEVSFWTLFTPKHESTPKFKIQTLNKDNIVIESITVDSQFSKDVKDNWVRIAAALNQSEDINEIRILSNSKKIEIVDDILIKYVNEDVLIDDKNSDFYLWNNYLVEK